MCGTDDLFGHFRTPYLHALHPFLHILIFVEKKVKSVFRLVLCPFGCSGPVATVFEKFCKVFFIIFWFYFYDGGSLGSIYGRDGVAHVVT